MQFDAILKLVGEFGPYQRRIYFLLCLPVLCIAMYDILSAYLMYTPIHRCAPLIAQNGSTTYDVDPRNYQNSSRELQYGECLIKAYGNKSHGEESNTTAYACSVWKYDQTVFTSTFVSEHNLVCASSSISVYIQVAIHCGSIVGSFVQGIISDRYGRKITFCGSTTLLMLAGLGSAFSTNIYMFTILRFIQSTCATSVYITAFVLGLEIVGPSKRRWAGILINYFYTAGLIVLSGIGYGLRHWKYIQIACSAPAALFLVYWWVIPESPRWLISQGKQEQAGVIILKIAKSNHYADNLTLEQLTDDDDDESVRQYRVWHLLSTWPMLFRSLIIWANWFVISLTYFGFYFNASNLSGYFYLNQLIAGLVEIPATLLLLPLLDTIGRKKLFILGMFIGGAFMLLTGVLEILISNHAVTVTLAMIGKLGITVGFSVMYIWAAELFPTSLRSTAMGLGCAFSNVGYIIMPYIVQMTSSVPAMGESLPLLLFGGLAIMASFLTVLLPETTNEHLPEILQTHKKRKRSRDTTDVSRQEFLLQS
ncbi:organic cation transporter protein-like [Ylistrum balloti]|uniref:organic cation transporter protein-like n=1 Tax=Ylistrum balloti TaxID=509963 RepID=UPI002905E67D|nr:organic cation transporter protein-like [Ylistrum balloti]